MHALRIAVWNVQWRAPGSASGIEIRRILDSSGADVLCLTEGYPGLLPESGFPILASPDHGYGNTDGRRKVLRWSRWPWTEVDIVGSPALPTGRFARGQLQTPSGPLTVIGVCIPWSGAHVSSGRRDRKRWQDHELYLTALADIIARERPRGPLLVAGDYNQRLPPVHTPAAMHRLLLDAIGDLRVCTHGPLPGAGSLSIDHVALSPDLTPVSVSTWPARGPSGRPLSDHFGISVDLTLPLGAAQR
jgi:endonuclease/exonuclease/phosphatase family metal-dependent hydrolase